MGILQLDMYPEATNEEINQTKSLLTRYRRYKAVVAELEGMNDLAPKQRKAYNAYLKATREIERAVRLILEPDVRKMIERRYIQGERHKMIVFYFSNMHPSTVDRKLNEGIESIANSLKLLEV